MRSTPFRRRALLSIAVGAVLAGPGAAAAVAQDVDEVAGGLANPRGIDFGPGGALYVAESGKGGTGACLASPEGGQACYGPTGAIARVNVRTGRVRRVVRGLPSLAVQEGEEAGGNATGPNDVSIAGAAGYFTVGLGGDPNARAQLGAPGGRFAGLYRFGPRGRVRRVADLGAYEARRNPDAGQPTATVDSNPFSVDASRPGRILVTDAGGNTLLRVGPRGGIRRLAVFPFGTALAPPFLQLPPGTEIPYQPVPTGVVRGPAARPTWGSSPASRSRPAGRTSTASPARARRAWCPTATPTWSTWPPGRAARLYVLQIASNGLAAEDPGAGKLIHLSRSGRKRELAAGQLTFPTGVAVGPNGDVYVADRGVSPTEGRIVRVSTG